jgi:hypothetical protein
MDWSRAVDLYCERTAPGLWNEPLNAATNAAFWLAAACVVWCCRRRGVALDAELRVLLGLLVAIGAASLAFHTLANRAAGTADTLAIAVYLHAAFALYLRRVRGWPWRLAGWGVPTFLALWLAGSFAWRFAGLQPASYLAAWCVLVALAVDSGWRHRAVARPLAAAAGLFALSLAARQADLAWCAQWPWGTHFAWHLLNAVTLGLITWAVAVAPTALRTISPRARAW